MSDATEDARMTEVLHAMEVADRLRHERHMRMRDPVKRRKRLLQRLHETYAAQGIVVEDDILEQAVDAVEMRYPLAATRSLSVSDTTADSGLEPATALAGKGLAGTRPSEIADTPSGSLILWGLGLAAAGIAALFVFANMIEGSVDETEIVEVIPRDNPAPGILGDAFDQSGTIVAEGREWTPEAFRAEALDLAAAIEPRLAADADLSGMGLWFRMKAGSPDMSTLGDITTWLLESVDVGLIAPDEVLSGLRYADAVVDRDLRLRPVARGQRLHRIDRVTPKLKRGRDIEPEIREPLYFLMVEAVEAVEAGAPDGPAMSVPVFDSLSLERASTTRWGIAIDAPTHERLSRLDKVGDQAGWAFDLPDPGRKPKGEVTFVYDETLALPRPDNSLPKILPSSLDLSEVDAP